MSDVPNDATTAVTLAGGEFLYGTIDTVGDEDWIRIDVAAGEHYRFIWYALSDTDAVGADVSLLDADGNAIVQVDNPGTWLDIFIDWTFGAGGTYYLSIGGAADAPNIGDYSLTANLITDSPLEAMDWGTYVMGGVVDVFFAPAGITYDTGDGEITAVAWTDYLMAREMAAFAEYASIANLTFNVTTDAAEAELTLAYYTAENDLNAIFGFFDPPGYIVEGLGGVHAGNPVWDPLPGGSVEQGGKDFGKMLHEAGHALGLAHPHDEGGASIVMQGVSTALGDYGDFDLNQGIYTLMSYNEGWATAPHGSPQLPGGGLDRTYGYAATPMAFDIALIQEKYGANTAYRAGDDFYVLPDTNGPGTFYSCIWDAGGNDTISAGDAAIGCTIDLRAATLRYEEGGGGWISWHGGIFGGVTIANGVVIEDAIGSSAADQLMGNAAANRLEGLGGDDTAIGGAGDDLFARRFDTDDATRWFRPNDAGTAGDSPSVNAAAPAWRNYTEKLAAWRGKLEATYGVDADQTTREVTVRDGKGLANFTFDNSYTRVIAVHGAEGADLVTDWGDGADKLEFDGMTRGQFLNLLSSGRLTVRSDADLHGGTAFDTVIAWADGSVILADVTVGATSLADSGILFD